ncbi:hypothetical protein Ahia01_000802200 [Argonauta hians]
MNLTKRILLMELMLVSALTAVMSTRLPIVCVKISNLDGLPPLGCNLSTYNTNQRNSSQPCIHRSQIRITSNLLSVSIKEKAGENLYIKERFQVWNFIHEHPSIVQYNESLTYIIPNETTPLNYLLIPFNKDIDPIPQGQEFNPMGNSTQQPRLKIEFFIECSLENGTLREGNTTTPGQTFPFRIFTNNFTISNVSDIKIASQFHQHHRRKKDRSWHYIALKYWQLTVSLILMCLTLIFSFFSAIIWIYQKCKPEEDLKTQLKKHRTF